jgi:hypothetical protein
VFAEFSRDQFQADSSVPMASNGDNNAEVSTANEQVSTWDISVTSLRKRLQCVDNLVSFASHECNHHAAKPGPLRKLTRAVVGALFERHFEESKWINALHRALFIICGLSDPPFSPVDFVVETVQELRSKNLFKGQFATVEIGCLLMHRCTSQTLITETPQWCSSLLLLVGNAVEDAALQTDQRSKLVLELQSKLFTLWRSKPSTLKLCHEQWISNKGSNVIVALATLVQFLSSANAVKSCGLPFAETLFSTSNSYVVDRYARLVFSPKQPSKLVHYMAHLNEYFNQLPMLFWDPSQSDDLGASVVNVTEGGLMAQIVKAMKRSSEGSSLPVATLLAQVNLNLSSFVTAGGAANAIKLIRSADSDVRSSGITMFRALAEKTRDVGAFRSVVQCLTEALAGKSGSLTVAIQRCAVVVALQHCGGHASVVVGPQFSSELFTGTVLPVLLAALDREMRIIRASCWLTASASGASTFIVCHKFSSML